MKNLIFLIAFILPACNLAAQDFITISGKVLDQKNKNPLQECNVYLSSLYGGVITNELGRFELRCPASRKNEFLVISFVGYLKYSIRIIEIPSTDFVINMKFDEKLLNDVPINAAANLILAPVFFTQKESVPGIPEFNKPNSDTGLSKNQSDALAASNLLTH